jgi:hypothetical protein
MKTNEWVGKAIANAKRFADSYRVEYTMPERQLSGMFEIGCLHALIDFYSDDFEIQPRNLSGDRFLYLTSPSGNPANFSYVDLVSAAETFQLRQQVRIRSHLHDDICFTPDLVVLRESASVTAITDVLFAGGKRRFFFVSSEHVVAAHECKSLNPFPELLIGFVGMYVAAHSWVDAPGDIIDSSDGTHLAPTLFVGGTARGVHVRMLSALSKVFCLNVVTGLHRGSWNLLENKELRRLEVRSAEAEPSEEP